MTGTQTGPFMGMPATGRQVDYGGLSVNVLSEGKIKSTLWGYNMLIMLQQLGLAPAMAAA